MSIFITVGVRPWSAQKLSKVTCSISIPPETRHVSDGVATRRQSDLSHVVTDRVRSDDHVVDAIGCQIALERLAGVRIGLERHHLAGRADETRAQQGERTDECANVEEHVAGT